MISKTKWAYHRKKCPNRVNTKDDWPWKRSECAVAVSCEYECCPSVRHINAIEFWEDKNG